jgi:AcrR family transcriptional regulator
VQILKEEVRMQILQSAERLFCEKGFLETTTRSIAKEVGISVSNLYLYYENKEMLFNAVAEPIFSKQILGFAEFMDHEDEMDELNDNISFLIGTMIASSKERFLLIFEKSKGTKFEGFQAEVIALIQKHIVKQMNDKVYDKGLLANVFAKNLIEGIITIVKAHKNEEHLEQNLQHLTDFYADGIKQFIK